MSLKLLFVVVVLLGFTHAADASVLAPPLTNSAVETAGGFGEPSPVQVELAYRTPVRRRRLRMRFADVADLLPWGLIIADRHLEILYASQRAIRVFASGAGLSCKKGMLFTERASLDRSLRHLVAHALSGDDKLAGEPAVLGIPDKDGMLRCVLRITAAGEGLAEPVAVIAVSDLSSCSSVRRGSVGRLFCLSDREAELAELFAIGCSLQEIALHMHVSINTARVHLQSVFHKTGCSSQVELARKIAALP
jgi:DNA-binding CsgD family transcriptional regulator